MKIATPKLKKPKPENPKPENPVLDKPKQAEPEQEKQHQLNIQELNTKESNIQSIYQSEKTNREIEGVKESIKENIDYDLLVRSYSKDLINGIVEIMLEVYMTNGTLTIGKNTVNANYAKRIFDKIDYDCIVYVIGCFYEVSENKRIHNIKNYLLTSLYNSPMTIDSYYTANCNYDMSN